MNRTEIYSRMSLADYKTKLVVTPLLNEEQVGPASIDIRLGSSIIIPRKTYMDKQDVTDQKMIREVEERLYERSRLRHNSKFILHPNQLILGVTYEYLSLPYDLCCTIASRSSWGRLGLVIATAAMVQPGYKGCLTLELVNLSESPIALYPGLTVGQLIFHEVPSKGSVEYYKGRYNCPTEAELPKFFMGNLDAEMEFWGRKK
ncbi:MAG: dCTP deaminase [candidate division Zixibacteria bacterium]|nr:dCTP deaminase [candidate division Zixibacteria bacterium]